MFKYFRMSFEIHWVGQYLANVVSFGIKYLETSEMTKRTESNACVGPAIDFPNFHPMLCLTSWYCCCLRLSMCVPVRPCVIELVCAITYQPIKLGWKKLDQRCEKHWLRSVSFYLFCGVIAHDLQGQLELKNKKIIHCELVYAISHHRLNLEPLKFGQKMRNTLVNIPVVLGVDWLWPLRSILT